MISGQFDLLSFARKLLLAAAGITAVTGLTLIAIMNAHQSCAQSNPESLIFEVASIRPAGKSGQEGGGPAVAQTGRTKSLGGMRSDPGRMSFTNASLTQLLERAYGVRRHQIAGPSWLNTDRFDIVAKIPEGVSSDQVPVMLQNLLIERFKLTLRREKKEMPIYALVVGRYGPKLEKAADGDEPARSKRGGININGGQLPGFVRIEGYRTTMSLLVGMLSGLVDRPVIDLTELSGTYNFAFETEGSAFINKGPMGGPGPEEKSGAAGHGGPAPDSTPSGSIFSDIQKLGLKLDSRKALLDFIIIEKGNRLPTEN